MSGPEETSARWPPKKDGDKILTAIKPRGLFTRSKPRTCEMARPGIPGIVVTLLTATMAAKTSAAPVICSSKDGKLFARNSSPCPPDSHVWRGAGANLFDVFWVASSGQNRKQFGFNYSLAELSTARAAGIRVFRAFASDWGPNKLFWKQHADQFVFFIAEMLVLALCVDACPTPGLANAIGYPPMPACKCPLL